jgi:hypothetical protein
VGGLLVAFVFLPDFKDQRWKDIRRRAARARRAHSTTGDAGAASAQRRLEAAAEGGESCWRRNRWVYWLLWTLCAVASLFFFLFLPLYIWLARLPPLSCPAVP